MILFSSIGNHRTLLYRPISAHPYKYMNDLIASKLSYSNNIDNPVIGDCDSSLFFFLAGKPPYGSIQRHTFTTIYCLVYSLVLELDSIALASFNSAQPALHRLINTKRSSMNTSEERHLYVAFWAHSYGSHACFQFTSVCLALCQKQIPMVGGLLPISPAPSTPLFESCTSCPSPLSGSSPIG